LSPWAYAVPHEDVVFGSGAHAIVADEVPKLERCWSDVQAVIAKYGDVVKIQLYVAGYTDTVGATGSNQQLSERRARAIAEWFRGRGFSGDIHYQGFGEGALAVPTGDEVDEGANRRALYVLAAEAPAPSAEMPAQRWTTLR
jgi:outer membrane protein OmpA-like peptidoglycan-associated protein